MDIRVAPKVTPVAIRFKTKGKGVANCSSIMNINDPACRYKLKQQLIAMMDEPEWCIVHSTRPNGEQVSSDVVKMDDVRVVFNNWSIRPGVKWTTKDGTVHTMSRFQ